MRRRGAKAGGVGVAVVARVASCNSYPHPQPLPSWLRACPLPANLKVPKSPAGRGLGGGGAERVSQTSIAVPPERGACRRHRRRVRGRGEGGHRNQHGQGESSDERLHGGSPYLDRCLCFASALKAGRPAPARENMAAPAAAACDGDHRFRTIQNDSDSAACGKRGALPRPAISAFTRVHSPSKRA